jgi:hypothetical protein
MLRISLRLIVIIGLLFAASVLVAQDDTCPAMVEQALETVDDTCAELNRNEACYGNTHVTATGWDDADLTTFTSPGDLSDIAEMALLTTLPFNLDENTWGIAMLALQADLPDTLPGQNVTFVVYGDAELQSEVTPADLAASPPSCSASATGGINLRSGPGTGYAITGGLADGDEVIVDGRNEAGDWIHISERAWVYTPLLTIDCDLQTLMVLEAQSTGTAYTHPMQAFRFTSGIGKLACDEVPRDGMLIQAPTNTVVHFLINGVRIDVGSTALLNVREDDALKISNFDGTVSVTSVGTTKTAEPGFQIIATPDEPPTEPEPYDYDEVRNAPVELLPEPVTIPFIVLSKKDWQDSGVMLTAGQSFTLRAGGTVSPCQPPPDVCRPYPPTGLTQFTSDLGVPGSFVGALIGKVGNGAPFYVGNGGTFTTDEDGMLQFRVDDKPLDNNSGAFTVVIETK